MRQIELEFAPMAAAKGLTLTYVPCSLVVHSDRRLLRRLVQNLVSNAVKYTPSGRVLVGCRRDGAVLRIDVYDTGIGIPQSKLRDVFVEFHRLDNGARIARGLGLGLSIVERIARVLGSEVDGALGRRPRLAVLGDGRRARTRRRSKCRRARTAASIPASSPASRRCASTTSRRCSTAWRPCSRGWGCEVLKAPNLTEALAAVAGRKAPPNGLLVDYHLDHGNGIEAIAALRAHAATCRRSSSPPTARRRCASRRGRRASRCSTSR